MSNLKIVAAVGACVIAAISLAQSVRTELQANLVGTGKGKVSWKVRDKGNEKQAEFEAEGERLAHNARYMLQIGSNAPILVTTNGLGGYNIEKRFTTSTRPTINAGDLATLVDGTGNVVESGKFVSK